MGAWLAWAALSVVACLSPGAATGSPAQPVPVLAYYYIWFNPTSWNRAKTDFPVLGRYSSDETSVMRRHVAWAKRAGIDGFLVSWKSSPVLDRRLARLIRVADEADFKLGIVYQGLDFHREPIGARRIGEDLDRFLGRYGGDRAFSIFGKPLIVLSGTWRYSVREIASITAARRDQALILASEKRARDYVRLASLVDGDAYYWSSVNPLTFPHYRRRLVSIGRVVHRTRGLWIAPAAPGFDARLVGGTRMVPRRGGATLRQELSAAMGSSPDAIGLISWNEFSENSQVEPSERDRGRSLAVLAQVLGAPAPDVPADSSDSGSGGSTGLSHGLPLIAGTAGLIATALGVIVWRGRRGRPRRRSPGRDAGPGRA
jgi:hypothetical protein